MRDAVLTPAPIGRQPSRSVRNDAVPRPSVARPVRVCFVIDELATAGTETQLLALIDRLDRRQVLPYLCLLRGQSPASQALEPTNCPVWRLGVGSLRGLRAMTAACQFARALRRERIDVVQAYYPDSSYFALPLAWLAGVPHRVRVRNNLGHWLTPFHRRLGRLLHRFTTLRLVNCTAGREALNAAEPYASTAIEVMENGVDLRRFDAPEVRTAATGPCIGMVANLRPVKGVEVFVQAAAEVARRHPQAQFLVAGEGPARPTLDQQIRNVGLAGRFRLVGAVQDVPRFLAQLDIAVLSSHAEGMSNALLEYMAAGRPIVATAVGAAKELIGHDRHGLLTPPGNARQLAEAIEALLHDPVRAQRLGQAARDRVERCYSRSAMVRRFEQLYARLGATARHGGHSS